MEDDFLEIDGRVDGFGGFYADSTGELIAWVRNASDDSRVLDEVRAAITRIANSTEAARPMRVRRAQYGFSELVAYQQLATELMAGDRLQVWTDADEKFNRVRIGISDIARADDLLTRLESAGAPREAFTIELARELQTATTLRDKFRPTGGGIQVKTWNGLVYPFPNLQWACTLGYNVTLASTGVRYMLYNSHCTGEASGAVGRQVFQKDVTGTDSIGRVAVVPAFNLTDPGCAGAPLCAYADAALVAQTLSVTNTPKRLIAPCGYSSNPTQPGTLTYSGSCGSIFTLSNSTVLYPFVGQGLQKIGRTSGWTVGLVTATCRNVDAHFGNVTYRVLCADDVGAYADLYDSGSPVFYHDTSLGANVRVPMGVLFGFTVDSTEPFPRTFTFSRRQMIELALGTLAF